MESKVKTIRYWYALGVRRGKERRLRVLEKNESESIFLRANPKKTKSLVSSGFISRWPGLLGSTKWRTPDYVVDRLLGDLLKIDRKKHRTFMELGCGDARVLIAFAKRYPWMTCVGYELNERVFDEAVRNVKKEGLSTSVVLRRSSAYVAPIWNADVVYTYSNRRGLIQMDPLLRRMKSGSILVLYQNDLEGDLPRASRRRVRCPDPDRPYVAPPVFIYERNGE